MRIVVVTGANKGIGKEAAKQLASKGFKVILTARDAAKGKATAKELGMPFYQLDVVDQKSIKKFASALAKDYDKVDVLVNNAGIFIDGQMTTADIDRKTLDTTLATNLHGPIFVTQALLPMLKKSDDPRVINVSSGLGSLSESMGGGYTSYSISKTALNAFTVKFSKDNPSIKIHSMCPGWVRTDMGGKNAERSVEQGADTITWLATEKNIPSGKFFRDRKLLAW